MNEGNSAGGGHEGLSPAPPAVPDRVTLQSTEKTVTAPKLATTLATHNNNKIAANVSTANRNQSQQKGSKQQQQQLPSAQLPVPLTPLQQQTAEATAAARSPAASSFPTSQTNNNPINAEESSSPTQPKRQRLDNLNSSEAAITSIVGAAVTSNVVGSLLPASVAASADVSGPSSEAQQDLIALKKRLLQQKYQVLRNLKERHLENVSEYFYLQNGGSMMDYPAWRKKTPTPQFISYSNANRIDQLILEDKPSTSAAAAAAQAQRTQEQQQLDTVSEVNSNINTTATDPTQADTTQQISTQNQLTTNIGSTISNASSNSSSNNNNSSKSSGSLASAVRSHPNSNCNNSAAPATLPTAVNVVEPSGNVLPPEAEIKIPAVGATPVAISTKLPAAVVQLTQQGGTPLVPCSTSVGSTALRRTDNRNTPNAAITSIAATPTQPTFSGGTNGPDGNSNVAGVTPCTPGSSLLSPLDSSATPNSAQEFSFKAKQEVYVMQRISELQREGLWTERRLPKLQEPSRPKAHWDYLLEEMVWLAADFAQERKWKKNAAKKCAKMVQKYFQDKANAAQRAEKAQELHLKRVASFISREVKSFWSNVEKLVEYKHQTKIEEKRKQALDQHLSFIVDQTEKFSQQLAEGMNKNVAETPSMTSSRLTSPKRESDDEFRPESNSEDDEETIAKADEEAADVNEEVKALAKESQMDFDDFLKDLPKGYLENRDKLMLEEQSSSKASSNNEPNETDDSEFEAKESSDDDENTISKQEETEMEVDHKKEIDELEADNDLSVEQLLEKYRSGKINESSYGKRRKLAVEASELDSDDDSTVVEDSTDDSEMEGEFEEDEDLSTIKTDTDVDDNEKEDGLKSLLTDADAGGNKDDMLNDAAALAESLQPKGNTLSSTNVVTPVPFLLKHSLREYQHIGLDWLVTMNERKLNGILADEMGLGKTIQTIALLAHLACAKGNWGPHLIVVPSSVMLNWEMEFKKWCPGFKILTYYGTQKERKLKRVGWTKPNAFHVCITSYKLVVQDQQSFRRKKWKYLILDEAQNIKNFKSQRWQLLLNFSTERRLLLTGTPLQNDLMELWSLMHFLMPYVFSSHREFKEWFSNPMTGMIEGNMEYNETLIARLHKVIRPFLLRRLKKEVEKQMPKKYEHVVMCRLSNRQRYLYEDFMSRSKTRETLQTGNLLSVINVLMQLRKVCNHPNMFEVRPTISPFQMEGITFQTPRLVADLMEYDPFTQINLHSVNLLLMQLENTLTAYMSHKSRLLAPPRKLIEEIDSAPLPPPRCPNGKYRFHVRVRNPEVAQRIKLQAVRVGASPAMRLEGTKIVPMRSLLPSGRVLKRVTGTINPINMSMRPVILNSLLPATTVTTATTTAINVLGTSKVLTTRSQMNAPTPAKVAKTIQDGKPFFYLTPATNTSGGGARLTLTSKSTTGVLTTTTSNTAALQLNKEPIVKDLATHVKAASTKKQASDAKAESRNLAGKESARGEAEDPFKLEQLLQQRKEQRLASLKRMASINKRRSEATPIYGADCRGTLQRCMQPTRTLNRSTWQTRGYANCGIAMRERDGWSLNHILKSYEQRCAELTPIFANFVIYVPSVCAPRIRHYVHKLTSTHWQCEREIETVVTKELSPKLGLLHPIISAMTTQFPDPRLIQYDCGKLQTLDRLLRQLKVDGHRVLIFTQMTKMLDVLEAFLNYHGHIYLRLDGSTRVEQRQILMERFNGDKRIFCFILSTRSGGVGINLTGADTVIFYDSDWNPTMDAQAQDRCHRIGQTRDVHIYRLVSEKTIEVNILKKANQKRMLSDMAIEGGNFTTTYFKSSTIKDLFTMDQTEQEESQEKPCSSSANDIGSQSSNGGASEPVETEKQSLRAFESALAAAEDEQDVQATKTAKDEAAAELAEFDENIPIDETITEGGAGVELSKADLEMQNLVKQLSPIERFAMRFVEATGAAWTAEQLRVAEAELEAQKREWEANRLAAMQKEEELLKQEAEAEELLTYNRKDASNQVNTKQERTSNRRNSIVNRRAKGDSKKLKHQVSNNSSVSNSSSNNSKLKNTKLAQAVSPVRTRRDSLNMSSSHIQASSKSSSNSKRAEEPMLPGRRQTRLHSLAVINVTVQPTRKTTRTAIAAAAAAAEGEEGNALEERPKRLSANIAMSKFMKAIPPAVASPKNSPAKRANNSLPVRRRRESVLPIRKKVFARRATISAAPQALKKSRSAIDVRIARNEDDDDEDEDESVCVDDDATMASAIETTTQTEDDTETEQEEMVAHSKGGKKRINVQTCEDGENDEDIHVDDVSDDNDSDEVDAKSSSSYATAGGDDSNANSMDDWSAHDQLQDTTMTSSTYYNVSEESDTDDNDPLALSANSKTPQLAHRNSSRSESNNTPRTRSRGTVKINLWSLDSSPVQPVPKPQTSKTAAKKTQRTSESEGGKKLSLAESTPLRTSSNHELSTSESKLIVTSRKPQIGKRVLLPSVGKKIVDSSTPSTAPTTTLHRWLTKTPRVLLRSTPAATTSTVSGTVSSLTSANGATR